MAAGSKSTTSWKQSTVCVDWKRRKIAKRSARALADQLGIVRRKDMTSIRILIEAVLPDAAPSKRAAGYEPWNTSTHKMSRPLSSGNSRDDTMDWPDVRGQPWRSKGSGGGRSAIIQRAIGAIERARELLIGTTIPLLCAATGAPNVISARRQK